MARCGICLARAGSERARPRAWRACVGRLAAAPRGARARGGRAPTPRPPRAPQCFVAPSALEPTRIEQASRVVDKEGEAGRTRARARALRRRLRVPVLAGQEPTPAGPRAAAGLRILVRRQRVATLHLFSPFQAFSGPLWLSLALTGLSVGFIIWACDVAMRSLTRAPLPGRGESFTARVASALAHVKDGIAGRISHGHGNGGPRTGAPPPPPPPLPDNGKGGEGDEGPQRASNPFLRCLGVRKGEEAETLKRLSESPAVLGASGNALRMPRLRARGACLKVFTRGASRAPRRPQPAPRAAEGCQHERAPRHHQPAGASHPVCLVRRGGRLGGGKEGAAYAPPQRPRCASRQPWKTRLQPPALTRPLRPATHAAGSS